MIARLLARWFLVALFGYTGGAKLLEGEETREGLQESGLFSMAIVTMIADALPVVEIGIATLLSASRLLPVALYSSLFLSLMFAGVHAITFVDGRISSCGCIGSAAVFFDNRVLDLAMATLSVLAVACSTWLLFDSMSRLPPNEQHRPN